MQAEATLNKWGNGAGLLIPKKFRDKMGVHPGDEFELSLTEDGGFKAVPKKSRPTLQSLMKGYEGAKPEFIDPGQSSGREIW